MKVRKDVYEPSSSKLLPLHTHTHTSFVCICPTPTMCQALFWILGNQWRTRQAKAPSIMVLILAGSEGCEQTFNMLGIDKNSKEKQNGAGGRELEWATLGTGIKKALQGGDLGRERGGTVAEVLSRSMFILSMKKQGSCGSDQRGSGAAKTKCRLQGLGWDLGFLRMGQLKMV